MAGASTKKTQGTRMVDATMYANGYIQLTSVDTATSIGTVPDDTILVIIIAEAQAIRWRDDAVNPTATVGMPLAVGQQYIYNGEISKLVFISQTAGAKVNLSFYK